jgi:chemotaxis protein CheX
MDVRYVNAFISSTRQVFAGMVKATLKVGKPYAKRPTDRLRDAQTLSAVIGMSGTVSGLIALSMSEPVSLALAAGFVGEPANKNNGDSYDAIAELANMIAGGAKKEFLGTAPVSLSIPKVMRGELVQFPRNIPLLVIPFETSVGNMLLHVALEHAAEQPAQSSQPAAANQKAPASQPNRPPDPGSQPKASSAAASDSK